jgi:hypothetical protein
MAMCLMPVCAALVLTSALRFSCAVSAALVAGSHLDLFGRALISALTLIDLSWQSYLYCMIPIVCGICIRVKPAPDRRQHAPGVQAEAAFAGPVLCVCAYQLWHMHSFAEGPGQAQLASDVQAEAAFAGPLSCVCACVHFAQICM